MLRQALVTALSCHQTFTVAVTGLRVTRIPTRNCSQRIASTRFTTERVLSTQVIEAFFTDVAALSLHVQFAPTLTSNETHRKISVTVTDPSILRTSWITGTWFAEIGVPDVPLRVLEVEGFALLAVAPHGVVLTVITHSPADIAGSQEDRHVKVTRAGMFVAVTLFAGVTVPTFGRSPRQIVVEIHAQLTVQAFSVVSAHAVPMNHSFHFFVESIHGGTFTGMTIAEAVPSNHHIINSVIVLLSDFHSGVQKVISQGVQFHELDSQVGDF